MIRSYLVCTVLVLAGCDASKKADGAKPEGSAKEAAAT
jgi:hypothetical protein